MIWVNPGQAPRSTPAAAPQPPSKVYVDFAADCPHTFLNQAIRRNGDVPYAAAYRASMVPTGSGGNRSVHCVAARPYSRRDPMQMCRLCCQRKGSKTPPGDFRFLSPRRKEHATAPYSMKMCTTPFRLGQLPADSLSMAAGQTPPTLLVLGHLPYKGEAMCSLMLQCQTMFLYKLTRSAIQAGRDMLFYSNSGRKSRTSAGLPPSSRNRSMHHFNSSWNSSRVRPFSMM